MKVYMIYDYFEDEIFCYGKLRPFCFSSFEKAEEFLFSENNRCTLTLFSKNEKTHTYTFKILEDENERIYACRFTYYKYRIFEVEVDKGIH